jgi:hypothetical protein
MKRIIHIQVPASMAPAQQQKVGEQIAALVHNDQKDSIFVTPSDVTIHNIQIEDAAQISGVYVYPLFSVEDIARIAFDTTADYSNALGEHSAHWHGSSIEVRSDVIRAVISALRYDPTPEQNHQTWLEALIKDGWKYGPEENAELKEHPDLVPFADLPADQQTKSALFLSLVKSLRSKLPAVSDPVQWIIKHVEDGAPREPVIFTELNEGDVFHFVDSTDGKVWRALSDVYVNYLSVPPVHTVDVEEYVQPEETAVENAPQVEGQ